MNPFSNAKFSIKTIATFSSSLGDIAEEYYEAELQKPNWVVSKEFRGSKIVITSKTGIKYKPDQNQLKKLEKETIKQYKNKLKLRKEGIK